MTAPPHGATAKNIRFVSRCDQGGRLDGVQVIVHKGHAFIGHMFTDGFSVVDVRDPAQARRRSPSSPRRKIPARIICKSTATFCSPSTGRISGRCSNTPARSIITPSRWPIPCRPTSLMRAGVRAFDISNPASPREIGFLQHGRPRRPSHLVGRRPLRLCLGAFRRLHRPHSGDHRCVRPDEA